MAGAIYYGKRHMGNARLFKITDSDEVVDVPLRLDLVNHSFDPEWGYAGSGPAQTALALLADVTHDDPWALAHYQDFKHSIVAQLQWEWALSEAAIQTWVFLEQEREAALKGGT